MKTSGQNLLALLVGRPATKVAYTVLGEGGGEFDSEGRRMSYGRNSASQVPVAGYRPQPSFRSTGNPRSAYTVLGQGGGEYDSDGRSLTQSGHRWGQGRVSMDDLQGARYRQDSRNRMNAQIASWERRQSDGRQRLSDQWVARQGYGTDDPFGIRRQYQQRRQQAAQGQQTWMTQNAELLKQHPELQRYAGYFSRNPAAWQKWQADAGLEPNTQTPPASVAAAPQPQKTPNVVTWSEGQPLPTASSTARATSPLQPTTPKPQATVSTPTPPTTAAPAVRNVQTWSPGQNLPGMDAQQTAAEQAKIQAQSPATPRPQRSYADRMAMMNQKFESFGGSVSGVFRGSGSPSSGVGYSQEELVKRYPQLKQYVDKGWYGGGKQPAAQSYTAADTTTPPGLPAATSGGSSPVAKTPTAPAQKSPEPLKKTGGAERLSNLLKTAMTRFRQPQAGTQTAADLGRQAYGRAPLPAAAVPAPSAATAVSAPTVIQPTPAPTGTAERPWTWGDKYGNFVTRLLNAVGRAPNAGALGTTIPSGMAKTDAKFDPDAVHDTLNSYQRQYRSLRNAAENAVNGMAGLVGFGQDLTETDNAYWDSIDKLTANMKTPLGDFAGNPAARASARFDTALGPAAVTAASFYGLGGGRLLGGLRGLLRPGGTRAFLKGAKGLVNRNVFSRVARHPEALRRLVTQHPYRTGFSFAEKSLYPYFLTSQGLRVGQQLSDNDLQGLSETAGELVAGVPLFKHVGPVKATLASRIGPAWRAFNPEVQQEAQP